MLQVNTDSTPGEERDKQVWSLGQPPKARLVDLQSMGSKFFGKQMWPDLDTAACGLTDLDVCRSQDAPKWALPTSFHVGP